MPNGPHYFRPSYLKNTENVPLIQTYSSVIHEHIRLNRILLVVFVQIIFDHFFTNKYIHVCKLKYKTEELKTN